MSSDSEDLEVDFPHYPPNQPDKVHADVPQEPNPPVDAPAEEQQEVDYPVGTPIEESHHPAHVPAEDVEPPQDAGNPNPVPV